MWEYGRDWYDLHNVSEDPRRIRARTPTPQQRSLAGDVDIVRRRCFCAMAGPLREVYWPHKFKVSLIERYDGFGNHKEFIMVYQTVIEAARRDDQVKANFLPTTLTGAARSWLINLPE
jgi:hypothetical protein